MLVLDQRWEVEATMLLMSSLEDAEMLLRIWTHGDTYQPRKISSVLQVHIAPWRPSRAPSQWQCFKVLVNGNTSSTAPS